MARPQATWRPTGRAQDSWSVGDRARFCGQEFRLAPPNNLRGKNLRRAERLVGPRETPTDDLLRDRPGLRKPWLSKVTASSHPSSGPAAQARSAATSRPGAPKTALLNRLAVMSLRASLCKADCLLQALGCVRSSRRPLLQASGGEDLSEEEVHAAFGRSARLSSSLMARSSASISAWRSRASRASWSAAYRLAGRRLAASLMCALRSSTKAARIFLSSSR